MRSPELSVRYAVEIIFIVVCITKMKVQYMITANSLCRLECFGRTEDNLWLLQFNELDKINFELSSIGFSGKIEDVYQEVEFSSAQDPTN